MLIASSDTEYHLSNLIMFVENLPEDSKRNKRMTKVSDVLSHLRETDAELATWLSEDDGKVQDHFDSWNSEGLDELCRLLEQVRQPK